MTQRAHTPGGRLFLILGDQLHPDPHPLLTDLDPRRDKLLMVEVAEEATHVWSHRARIALFLSAMRHRAHDFRATGVELIYWALGEHPYRTLAEAVAASIDQHHLSALVVLEAGDHRVTQALNALADEHGLPIEWRADPHFLCRRSDFARWSRGKRSWRLEHFYRWQRQQHDILMHAGEPVGGQWNFDHDNRGSFGRAGPAHVPPPPRFAPDKITREVLSTVEAQFPNHPGSLDNFAWPVTPADAQTALDSFIRERLPQFGPWQDAMWTGQPTLWHALLSPALNLKLLDPRTVIQAALAALERGDAPLASVEGFVRQILGWREFVRGLYDLHPDIWPTTNQYDHHSALPEWFWTGETRAQCLRSVITQSLELGYAHHIQRLMVTGNFALLAGLSPRAVADWYLAMYVDAVAWVEEPNTLGMALHAWSGMTSKPYCASGAYIQRMSNYCQHCPFDPAVRVGPTACPFTTLYWDFLERESERLGQHPRMRLMLKHLAQRPAAERDAVRAQAQALRADLTQLAGPARAPDLLG